MTPLIILLSTILVGFLFRKKAVPAVPARIITYIVWLLLFFLGISLGSNPTVIENLGSYGIKALIIGVLAAIGSGLAALLLSGILPEKKTER